ncbi:MAG: DUF3426 domain-containing protein [Thermodesulfobacteriota bacterium]
MTRIVGCGSCGAHFRLNEELLKGAKGARIRCRKCGGAIEFRIGETAPEPVPAPEPAPALAALPEPLPEPERGDDSVDSVYEHIRRLYPPPAAPPPPPEEPPLIPLEPVFAPQGFPARKRGLRVPILAGAAAFLGIALGAGFLLPREPHSSRLPAPAAPAAVSSRPAVGPYTMWEKKGYLSPSGKYFVVSGRVTNSGGVTSAGIRVRAVLRDIDNNVLAEKESYAGNMIGQDRLPGMSREEIEERLGNRNGDMDSNRAIPPRETLPFMIVVFDLPRSVGSFSVEATDAPAPLRAP